MRTAICTLDGITYQADDFSQATDFVAKKRFLECPGCRLPAFYKGPSRNGRVAHFGARPHAEGCDYATAEHDGTATGQGNEEDEVLTTGQRIVLDLNYGTPEGVQGEQRADVPVVAGHGGTTGAGGPVVRETMTRRLRPILRTLMESEEFRRSTQVIEIPRVGEFMISEFLVRFDEVTDDHIGTYHGYWGMVPDARIAATNGSLWFNSGGCENLSVYLDQGDIEPVYQRFNIQDEEDIVGAYILVLGILRRSQGNGKKYVGITSPESFTLRLVR